MPDDPPMHVYPNPDGTDSSTTVPSNAVLDGVSLASGAAAVVTAVAGSGTGSDISVFLFQAVPGAAIQGGWVMFGAASSKYVTLFIFFASLSVVLGTINLVRGIRMKERLRKFSRQVFQVCVEKGLVKKPVA